MKLNRVVLVGLFAVACLLVAPCRRERQVEPVLAAVPVAIAAVQPLAAVAPLAVVQPVLAPSVAVSTQTLAAATPTPTPAPPAVHVLPVGTAPDGRFVTVMFDHPGTYSVTLNACNTAWGVTKCGLVTKQVVVLGNPAAFLSRDGFETGTKERWH